MPPFDLTLMRRLDRWLGVPLAWLLGLVSRPPRCLMGDSPAQVPARVVVTSFLGLGPVVLSLPLLAALRATGAKVVLWTSPGPAALVRELDVVDELWVIEPTPTRFLASLFTSLARARAFAPLLVVDLEPTAYGSAILAWLSRAPERVGFLGHRPLRERLFTRLVALNAGRHLLDQFATIADLLGLDGARASFPPVPSSPPSGSLQVLLPKHPEAQLVVVNLGPHEPDREQRRWPTAHWAALVTLLTRDPRVRLLFTGVAEESEQVQAVWREVLHTNPGGLPVVDDEPQLVDLCGNTTLADLLALLHRAALVVSVDTALIHLAALARTPVVALFGPHAPTTWEPRHGGSRALYAGLPCSPCWTFATDAHSRCRDNQCMKRLAPAAVAAAAATLLAER